jgi:hypothetical protein
MSYSLLGMLCKSQTIAYTSNHKFLPLHSPEYLKKPVCIIQYPINNHTISVPYKDINPNVQLRSCKNC